MNAQPPENQARVDDLLDKIVGEYSDRVAAGEQPLHGGFLDRVPALARPGLERCLKVVDAGQMTAGATALGPGVRLGKFEIQREIGRGGMAVVYLATDPELRRPVALKVLRAGLALDQVHVDRFQREGRAIARLQHPGVVQVHEVGSTSGFHWIAMEYVAGPSLATIIEAVHESGEPSAERLARAVGDISLIDLPGIEVAAAKLLEAPLAGLIVAHEAGIVHRDIKPSNILVHPDGRAVLADFGLARSEGDPGLSLTGEPIGTPHYMAPEQAQASVECIDARTDVYGFGVMLYELISGERPFEGESVIEVLDAIRFQRPRPLRSVAPWASDDSDAVVRHAMMREADRRYGSAAELADDLVRLQRGIRTVAGRAAGGRWRRFWSEIVDVLQGRTEEYRSSVKLLGLPLVHIVGAHSHRGPAAMRRGIQTAKGWIAIGQRAVGVFAIGGLSFGVVSMGGLSGGLLATGGCAIGMVTAGGISVGARAFGGLAVGDIALGGMAFGRGAVGGMAVGKYVIGDSSMGQYTWVFGDPAQQDPEVLEFFSSEPEPFRAMYMGIFESKGSQVPR